MMGGANQQERPLDPWYVTGFFEGEGCFSVTIHPNPNSKFGWLADPDVQVYQHQDSRALLERIQAFFGCGRIGAKGPNSSVLTYSVYSRRTILEKIVPHFERYPLQSVKHNDFLRMREILWRMEAKAHWEREGLIEIARLSFSMNAHGKQRKYTLDQVIDGILRGHTPDAPITPVG